jgi:hypothetical protein
MFDYKTKSERNEEEKQLNIKKNYYSKKKILGLSACNKLKCPYGRCKQKSNGQVECECRQCSTIYSDQDIICGNNGITYA